MVVVYCYCRATDEGDPAEYRIATDYETSWLDREALDGPSECMWFVPGFPPIER